MDKCSSIGCSIVGGFEGKGGISCRARMGEIGVGAAGVGTCRYQGIDSEDEGELAELSGGSGEVSSDCS